MNESVRAVEDSESEFERRLAELVSVQRGRFEALLRKGLAHGQPSRLAPDSERWVRAEARRMLSREIEALQEEHHARLRRAREVGAP